MSPETDAAKLLEQLQHDEKGAVLLNRLVEEAVTKREAMRQRAQSPERIASLRDRFAAYQDKETFEPGDLVVWKPGLRNRNLPDYDVPAIVVEVVDPPIVDEEKGSGSTYFREPLSLRLAVIDSDDDYLMYHYDGNRFTHFRPG